MPPQRRNPGPAGPRRRPKIAGSGRVQGGAGPSRPSEKDPAIDAAVVPDPEAPESPEAPEPGPATGAGEGTPVTLVNEPAGTDGPEASDTDTAGDTDAAANPESDDPEPEAARRDGRRPIAIVGAAAVVLGAFAAVAAFQPGAKVENRAWVDAAATREVQQAATRAIETMHGYDYRTIDDNFAAIRDLLTPQMQEEFDKTSEVTKQAAVQTHTVTQVEVTNIGTSILDDTRAEVSAYLNVSATGDGIAQGSAAAPLLVRMEKVDGRWLVSELKDS